MKKTVFALIPLLTCAMIFSACDTDDIKEMTGRFVKDVAAKNEVSVAYYNSFDDFLNDDDLTSLPYGTLKISESKTAAMLRTVDTADKLYISVYGSEGERKGIYARSSDKEYMLMIGGANSYFECISDNEGSYTFDRGIKRAVYHDSRYIAPRDIFCRNELSYMRTDDESLMIVSVCAVNIGGKEYIFEAPRNMGGSTSFGLLFDGDTAVAIVSAYGTALYIDRFSEDIPEDVSFDIPDGYQIQRDPYLNP